MREICSLLLAVILIFIGVWHFLKTRDFCSPIVFLCFITFLRYVPGILFLDSVTFVFLDEENTALVFLYETVAIFCVVIGYSFYGCLKKDNVYVVESNYSNYLTKHKIFIFYAVGFLSALYLIYLRGGLLNILFVENTAYNLDGMGYVLALQYLMVLAVSIYVKYSVDRSGDYNSVILWLMIFGYIIFPMIGTRRSPVVEFAIAVFFILNYVKGRFELGAFVSWKACVLYILLIGYISIMPILRSSDGILAKHSDMGLSSYSVVGVDKFFREISCVGVDAFVYTNYDSSNFWYGANLINILCAPLPSTYFSWKPPVDDGTYIANAIVGYKVAPPSRNIIWSNSVPLTMHSGFFVNFGVMGLIMGSLLQGYFYGYMYKLLKDSNFDPMIVLVYELALSRLKFNSLHIVQFLIPVFLMWIVMRLFFGWRMDKDDYLNKR